MLGISTGLVYSLASSRRLTSYRIGGAVRFAPADVNAFLESCRVDAQSKDARAVASPATTRLKLSPTDPDTELQRFFKSHGVKPRVKRPG